MIHTHEGISFELPQRFVIYGNPTSWKNSKSARVVRGVARVTTNDRARKWMKRAVRDLISQRTGGTVPKGVELHIIVKSFCKTRSWIDLDNLFGGPFDALQKAGVISDDRYVACVDGSRRTLHAKTPRVEITVALYRG